jgi:hypothetical protein
MSLNPAQTINVIFLPNLLNNAEQQRLLQ